MNAHTPTVLTETEYEQVKGALASMLEQRRQAYREGCAARSRGELEEAELLRLKAAVDEDETRLGVLENSRVEQQRVSDLQAVQDDAEARAQSVEVIENAWGDVEESFTALIDGIAALHPHASTIHQALENIVREAAPHRRFFGSHQMYGELIRDVREIDFRMSALVSQALFDARLGTFASNIGNMSSQVENSDPASALTIKRRVISSLLGQLSNDAGLESGEEE